MSASFAMSDDWIRIAASRLDALLPKLFDKAIEQVASNEDYPASVRHQIYFEAAALEVRLIRGSVQGCLADLSADDSLTTIRHCFQEIASGFDECSSLLKRAKDRLDAAALLDYACPDEVMLAVRWLQAFVSIRDRPSHSFAELLAIGRAFDAQGDSVAADAVLTDLVTCLAVECEELPEEACMALLRDRLLSGDPPLLSRVLRRHRPKKP